jgi:ribonuclease D
VEIFLQQTGKIPAPLFDTQIAAAACGLGEQPGYATLVSSLLGLEIDKSSQATDWSLRPLSARQVEYAIGDVTHLCKIYEHLQADLARTGRTAWIAEEMAGLVDERRYRVDPREAYRRLKIRGPSRKTLNVLRELAAWREQTAQERDLPRPWVVADEALVEIAQHRPEDVDALARVRALKPAVARGRDGQALLDVVRFAMSVPEDEWPEARERKATPDRNDSLVALLQALLRLRCDEAGVASWLVASRDDLDVLATAAAPDVPAVSGWRRALFGEDALALRDGRLALTGKDGGVIAVAR